MKTLPIYDIEHIVETGRIEASVFSGLRDDPDGINSVRTWRKGTEDFVRHLDTRWVEMCGDDITELTDWSKRMGLIRSHLDEIDRQLLAAGTRLFDWNKVSESMGLVNSFRISAEQVLAFNEE